MTAEKRAAPVVLIRPCIHSRCELLESARPRHLTWHVLIDAFESPWVYVSDGAKLEAIDLARGERQWQRPISVVPFEALDDRHVVVSDPARGRVMELDDRGHEVFSMRATVKDARIVVQGNGIFHGFDPATRSVVEISEPAYIESGWFLPRSHSRHVALSTGPRSFPRLVGAWETVLLELVLTAAVMSLVFHVPPRPFIRE